MSDYSENLRLLRKALVEATISKYEEELRQCDENVTFLKRHEEMMKRILQKTEGKETFDAERKSKSTEIIQTKYQTIRGNSIVGKLV